LLLLLQIEAILVVPRLPLPQPKFLLLICLAAWLGCNCNDAAIVCDKPMHCLYCLPGQVMQVLTWQLLVAPLSLKRLLLLLLLYCLVCSPSILTSLGSRWCHSS